MNAFSKDSLVKMRCGFIFSCVDFDGAKGAYSPFLGFTALSSPESFCLFQFSIKLICNSELSVRHKDGKKKLKWFFMLGIFAEAEPTTESMAKM